MKVALTDMDIIWEDKGSNQLQCRSMAEEAAFAGADFILFPEMTLTGFSFQVDKIKDEQKETVAFFSRLAKEYHIAIGFGYVTAQAGRGRNHFCVVDRNGCVLADYIKIHPFTFGGEAQWYDGGDRICHLSLDEFLCGAFICYDLRFPEVFQQLPLETDAIFLIANWPENRLEHWYALLKARAIEMQCFVVGVNRIGRGGGLQYCQSSVAYGADGRQLEEVKGEKNRYVMLDRQERLSYVNQFSTRADRRPELYYEGK